MLNLLFDGEAEGVTVTSALPREGRVRVRHGGPLPVMLRLPSWADGPDTALRVDGELTPVRVVAGYVLIPAAGAMTEAELTFRVPEYRTEESISYEHFTIDWLGDQITAMSPAASFRPMFPPVEEG